MNGCCGSVAASCTAATRTSAIGAQAAVDGMILEFLELTTAIEPTPDEKNASDIALH